MRAYPRRQCIVVKKHIQNVWIVFYLPNWPDIHLDTRNQTGSTRPSSDLSSQFCLQRMYSNTESKLEGNLSGMFSPPYHNEGYFKVHIFPPWFNWLKATWLDLFPHSGPWYAHPERYFVFTQVVLQVSYFSGRFICDFLNHSLCGFLSFVKQAF